MPRPSFFVKNPNILNIFLLPKKGYRDGYIETSIPLTRARATSSSVCGVKVYGSATIGEPIASTGRTFIVARRRQYRQGASKLMRRAWTSTHVRLIGALAKMALIG